MAAGGGGGFIPIFTDGETGSKKKCKSSSADTKAIFNNMPWSYGLKERREGGLVGKREDKGKMGEATRTQGIKFLFELSCRGGVGGGAVGIPFWWVEVCAAYCQEMSMTCFLLLHLPWQLQGLESDLFA